jgi:trk system potassium uptake protein TrkA
MFVVIVGTGRIGYHLARTLIEEGHELIVVDKDGDVCQEVAAELECTTVRGDATKPRTLEEANVREADNVIALTGSDETNLVVCLMAKQMGARYVAARLGSLHYDEETLKKLGLDLVIYPEAAAAGYISELVTKPDVLDLAFIARGHAEIVELEVTEGSKIIDQKIEDIENPQGTAIIAFVQDNKIVIPDPKTKIKNGDRVLVLATTEKIQQVMKLIKN